MIVPFYQQPFLSLDSISKTIKFQQLVDRMCSHWLSQACWQLSCYKPAADLLQAWWTQQPCYKLFQQLVIGLQVNKLWVTNLVQLDKITALLQTCYKIVASWQVVDKVCIFACVYILYAIRNEHKWFKQLVKWINYNRNKSYRHLCMVVIKMLQTVW